MAERRTGGSLPPRDSVDIASVAAHYDKGDRIIRTFVDPQSLMYTCALWRPGIETLAQAQIAKVDHTLAKLNLRPNQLLLDIGSGYGFVLRRARELYGVRGVGLNISQAQVDCSNQAVEGNAGIEYRFQGWEDFNQPVDAIVSIGAFEQFGRANYPAFFEKTRVILPEGGLMLLHTIVFDNPPKTMEFARYAHFIHRNIFPNGELPYPNDVPEVSTSNGFTLVNVEALNSAEGESYYAQTLDKWAANLRRNQQTAISETDKATYDLYMKYLTESAYWFRQKAICVRQYLLQAA